MSARRSDVGFEQRRTTVRKSDLAVIGCTAALCAILAPLAAGHAIAAGTGVVETPTRVHPETGVGLISGWHCTARTIQIRIDDGLPQTTGAGTSREDTRSVCGRADTGFGLLFNFNRLDPGAHSLTAYADGVAFQTVEFRTLDFGADFLRGVRARYPLRNFPEVGETTFLEWNEELQKFSVSFVGSGPPVAGDYFGAKVERDCPGVIGVRYGTFRVTTQGPRLGISIQWADGATEVVPEQPFSVEDDGDLTVIHERIRYRVNGDRLVARWPFIDQPCLETEIVAARSPAF